MEDITDTIDIIYHQHPVPPPSAEENGVLINIPLVEGAPTMQLEEPEEVSLARIIDPKATSSSREQGETEENDSGEDTHSKYREAKATEESESEESLSSSSDSSGSDDDDGDEEEEWVETLVYVDLDDIPSIDELFAVEPNEFLTCQSKIMREQPKPKKATHPEIELKFYNLDGTNPVLQIGQRFYLGKFQDTFGSNLFFREKTTNTDGQDQTSPLTKLTKDHDPPLDPVFSKSSTKNYELVANVQKVLRMTRNNIITDIDKLNMIQNQDPGGPSVILTGVNSKPGSMNRTVTIKDALAHKYIPKRRPDLRITKETQKEYNRVTIPGRSHAVLISEKDKKSTEAEK